MKKLLISLIFVGIWAGNVFGQDKVVSRKQFFTDTALVIASLRTDLKKLSAQRKNPSFQPGKITWFKADTTGDVTANIKVRLRGNYRRENCGLASLMVEFRDSINKSRLNNLKNLKLVAPCARGFDNEQYVIKEFLVYKIYNLLTEKSFRVRLMQLTFEDANDKMKPYKQYAFAIEPIDDLGKRHDCVEKEEQRYLTEQTNRSQTTLVTMFQFMIGNTDWSIPVYHNIKLLLPVDSPAVEPYVIPYDFDYCGLVNAPYAIPHETTGLTTVTERKYMGFPRTLEEIKSTAEIFQLHREEIFNLVNSYKPLSSSSKREMLNYLDDFYDIIKSENQLRMVFINGARKQ